MRQLVEDSGAMARVAREALERCHFDEAGEDTKEDCEAACYECLMSFGNQQDALQLDRKRIREILLALAEGRTLLRSSGRDYAAQLAWLRSFTDSRSEIERRFLDTLAERNCRLPDEAQRSIATPRCIPDFFYEPNICVFCDGAVHDEPDQIAIDNRVRPALISQGYRVIVVRYDRDIWDQISIYPEVLGNGQRIGVI